VILNKNTQKDHGKGGQRCTFIAEVRPVRSPVFLCIWSGVRVMWCCTTWPGLNPSQIVLDGTTKWKAGKMHRMQISGEGLLNLAAWGQIIWKTYFFLLYNRDGDSSRTQVTQTKSRDLTSDLLSKDLRLDLDSRCGTRKQSSVHQIIVSDLYFINSDVWRLMAGWAQRSLTHACSHWYQNYCNHGNVKLIWNCAICCHIWL